MTENESNTAPAAASPHAEGAPTTDAAELYDITIIGAGPTGLYGAFYSGLRQMKTKIIDSLMEFGGQLAALYPEKYIYDVGGFPKILAKDLVQQCVEQAMQYAPTVCLGEGVLKLERTADGHFALTTDKAVHYTKTVLIAAGVGAFSPRPLNVPGIEELLGRGIQYFVSDLGSLADKRVVIVGGGDSAFDWALALSERAQSVVQIHRSDRFRAHEDTVQKVCATMVDLRRFHEVRAVHGSEQLEAVTIFDNRSQDEMTIECDHLLLSLGFNTNLGPIKDWGLDIERNAIRVDSTMQTNVPGVYAAGDICTFHGKLKLISTGMGEAAIAANFAKTYIDPTSRAFPGHSSERSS